MNGTAKRLWWQRVWAASVLVVCWSCVGTAWPAERLDLSGTWAFTTDPNDVGVGQKWYSIDLPLHLRLPGSMEEQGFGDDVGVDTEWIGSIVDRSWFTSARYAPYRQPGNIKVPFWLQPLKHYVGPAWYQKTVVVPEAWKGKRVVLFLERPHWQTQVWWDGRLVGRDNSLSTPHVFELSDRATPGPHRLTIRVDNRILDVDPGINSHSVSDHTQTAWNGIIGRIELRATDWLWIDDVQVFPDLDARTAHVKLKVGNRSGKAALVKVTCDAVAFNTSTPHDPPPQSLQARVPSGTATEVTLDYPLGEGMQTWDEFRPTLYRLSVRLEGRSDDGRSWQDERTVTFGMRQITTQGTQFVLNGRPIFLRGTLECCIFPKTGYPPTDVDSWLRVFRILKAHGLNHVRFHSWCPPEAAFEAADRTGIYFQVECSSWANRTSALGLGKPIDAWLYREADRILRNYGNHPSFLLLAYGNEPGGPERGAKYLRRWVEHFKAKDQRRLYTSGSGWPIIPESQYHVSPKPRIHHWGAGLRDRINQSPPATVADYRDTVQAYDVPFVAHEIGQWCVYPNFDEIKKYTGVLRAKNFEIFRDFLEANHMGDQAHDFLMASGKLQVLCYKEEIESALRTPGFGGFQLLQLHDFPGQGTALVGVLDAFFDSKPYVTPEQFRRFCAPVVPLARLPKRILLADEKLQADIELYQFGPVDLADTVVRWSLLDSSGREVAVGSFPRRDYPAGGLHPVGRLSVSLANTHPPEKLKLVVGVEGTTAENDWDVWVYPTQLPKPKTDRIRVATELDEATVEHLRRGGKALLLVPPHCVQSDVVVGFSTVFWNTAWTRNQPPHTLGILCNPKHPAFAHFPTEFHTNWQWWELLHDCAAMVLNDLPPELRPLVQLIDTWFEARRLGLVFEARVAGGKLLVCSIDLSSDLEHRPVARQLRYSLLQYMASDAFDPKVAVSVEAVRQLMRQPSAMQRLEATVRADSEHPGLEAANVLDGDPQTFWHTRWGANSPPYPHWLVIDLKEVRTVQGLVYVPRQDLSNGRIGRFSIFVSNDGKKWSGPVASGTWPNSRQRQLVRFDRPVPARYVKLLAEREVKGRAWASAAEVEVLLK